MKNIKWSIRAASAEFGMNRLRLTRRLRAAGQHAGDDGKFTTQQILAAINGDRKTSNPDLMLPGDE